MNLIYLCSKLVIFCLHKYVTLNFNTSEFKALNLAVVLENIN